MIDSILDTDKYKFTMQQAVQRWHPNAIARYKFTNRNPADKFTPKMFHAICEAINNMAGLRLTESEAQFLQNKNDEVFSSHYITSLLNTYRYNPEQINTKLTREGELSLEYEGLWQDTILWEVPLMFIISEAYFADQPTPWEQATEKLVEKRDFFDKHKLRFMEFGTRRRRSFEFQNLAIDILKEAEGFLGTSNLYFAQSYGLKGFGSMAHEIFMGTSGLTGVASANHNTLFDWVALYGNKLSVALTDTFTTDYFLKQFDFWGLHFQGLRQDSGDPLVFVDKVLAFYERLEENPKDKTIYFSDGLTPEKCLMIRDYVGDRIKSVFCLGTNLTNDVEPPHHKALNMVIKMVAIAPEAGEPFVPVVKLGDGIGKESGNPDEVLRVKNLISKEQL